MDYYLAIKINEPLVNEIIWMNFKITILVKDAKQKIFIVLSHFYKILENKN